MENTAARDDIIAADRQVGIVVAVMGVVISVLLLATVAGLSLYHSVYYP